jgi:hypothetical protein
VTGWTTKSKQSRTGVGAWRSDRNQDRITKGRIIISLVLVSIAAVAVMAALLITKKKS